MSHNILVVDDSATTRTYVKRTLALSGIAPENVFEAASGREALDRLAQGDIDLVLSDLNMPEMDGTSLVREMAATPQLAFIPVIIISTEGSKPKLEKLLRSSVVGFLRKPFTPEQLRDILQDRLVTT